MPEERKEDWIHVRKGNQLVLYSAYSGHEGIRIGVNKGKRTLTIGGWYDGCVGLRCAELSLKEIQDLFQPKKKSK
jgi:hypothetical protein